MTGFADIIHKRIALRTPSGIRRFREVSREVNCFLKTAIFTSSEADERNSEISAVAERDLAAAACCNGKGNSQLVNKLSNVTERRSEDVAI
jgi:hypothetical protein